MASKAAHKRLMKEHAALDKSPPPYIIARPKESDILEWHYIMRGPPDTPFDGGEFWGTVIFQADYPFKPPGIKMLTPSGRFQPDRKICTSMSDFHPGSWNPAWSVATILTGLLSFMVSDEMAAGSVRTSDADKKTYARRSHTWNIAQPKFRQIFPDYSTSDAKDLPNMGERRTSTSASTTVTPSPAATLAPATVLAAYPAPPPADAPPPARQSSLLRWGLGLLAVSLLVSWLFG